MAEYGSFVYIFDGKRYVADQNSVEPLEQLLKDEPDAMVRIQLVSGGLVLNVRTFQGFEVPRPPSKTDVAERYIPEGYQVIRLHPSEYVPRVDHYGPYTLQRVHLRPSMIIVPTPL